MHVDLWQKPTYSKAIILRLKLHRTYLCILILHTNSPRWLTFFQDGLLSSANSFEIFSIIIYKPAFYWTFSDSLSHSTPIKTPWVIFLLALKRIKLSLVNWSHLMKAMAPHSSTLVWKIPWTEEPGRLQSMGLLGVGHDWATSLSGIGEGNGNPLQCSCLENPKDRGAWWAAISGVAQSRTRLKQLSSSSRDTK